MAYAEVEVIVNGALEETEYFHDETLMHSFINEIKREATDHGYSTDIYVLWHGHNMDSEECFCSQYQIDGRPVLCLNSWDGEKGKWQ